MLLLQREGTAEGAMTLTEKGWPSGMRVSLEFSRHDTYHGGHSGK